MIKIYHLCDKNLNVIRMIERNYLLSDGEKSYTTFHTNFVWCIRFLLVPRSHDISS